MTHDEYIKKLTELKAKAERAVVGQIPEIEKQALRILQDFIDENVDTKNGDFVVNDKAVKALNSFTDEYLKAVTELKNYKGMVGQYLKNFKDVDTLMEDFQKSNGVNVNTARLGAVQEIVTNEILNRYSENGLNKDFVQPLRELLFNNITGGLNKKQAMAQLRDYIESGKDTSGKLARYLEQTAQQGVDSYTGAVNVRIMQTFKIDTYVMSGSLIATSSPQCRFVFREWEGLIDRKDWPKLENIADDNGLIEGTDFDNLPINKLHWGCRHEFTPLILTEEQKKKIKENPVNQPGGEKEQPRPAPKPAPKPLPLIPAFIPAKTVKEAEDRIKEIGIKEVNLSKLNVEQSNTVLKTVSKENEFSPVKIEKITTYRSSSSPNGALYSSSNNHLSINASNIKKFVPKENRTFEQRIEKIDELIKKYQNEYLGNPKYNQRSVTSRILQFEQNKGRLQRQINDGDTPKHFTYTETAKDAAESFEMLITHEIGHYRHYKQIGEKTYFTFNKKNSNTDYGASNEKEYLTEWYTQYRFRGPDGVPKDLLELFKKL